MSDYLFGFKENEPLSAEAIASIREDLALWQTGYTDAGADRARSP